ncbi:hypothetical protein [Paenibacillus solani]|uniref:Uncharacterized protein n=1 Tax=Paenibacillus solani TaxID=1705565 RepID=A0A0M1P053_9BACL|nr:hypothetical protein [Paenibacillus solani]KOR87863.1 hypothetical protein AM231_01065 [Paenibacillus solani]
MQIKYMDWRSDQEVEEERLALTYHHNSNLYPQFDVLTRSRMKMLKRLFSQMNQTVTPAKRYYASPRYSMKKLDRKEHPFIANLANRLDELQENVKPYKDFESLRELGAAHSLDSPDIYLLSKNRISQELELFYCSPAEGYIEFVKGPIDPNWHEAAFDPGMGVQEGDGAVFITANLHRSMKLFGERGYRLSLLEGGRLTERLLQCTKESGSKVSPLMTFYDKAVHELLGIDGYYEVVLSVLTFREEELICTNINL